LTESASASSDGETDLSRRGFLEAAGGTAAAAAVTGFSGVAGAQDGNETGGGEPSEQPLRLTNSTMTTLDPISATDTASGVVIQQLFDALMNYPNGEIAVETLLASGYETSDDFTTYTFDLKEGATFHDGTEVTAQDFIYAWERLAASENSRRAYFILESIGVVHDTEEVETDGETTEQYVPGSLAVEAVDDYTLEMELEEPFHATLPMLAYTSFAALPEGIVGDVEGYDGEMDYQEFATSNPVGAGPYQFESWETNTSARVSAYTDHHGSGPAFSAVRWQIIEDPDALYNYAMNRNADIFGIPTSKYDPNKVSIEETDDLGRESGTYGPLRNGDTANYLAVNTINAFYLGFNTNAVERPARVAAAYALDQQTAVDQVFKGRGTPAYHFTPPNIYPDGVEQYDQHAQDGYPYGYNESQLEQARQVMEDAGYSENDRYEFTITTYQSDTWQQIAQILQDQLRSAYIDVSLEQAPFSTLLERGRSGNLQAYSLGWIMDWPAPDNFLQLLYPPRTDTSNPAPLSYTNWSDTEAAQQTVSAWEQIQNNTAPTDEAESTRNEAYVQIEEANWEDMVFLPVYHRTDERFWYQNVSVPTFGGAGTSRQMFVQGEFEEGG
jgi:peptide/nickel transport system substrate-binding protein